MGFVEINPRYRPFLKRLGLIKAEQFLALSGWIVSGHPYRNVSRIGLGSDVGSLACFLKREHRVRWRDRLASCWAGFGWVSKSVREGRMLRQADAAGISCPEFIAAGEDRQGRAFLLVPELAEAVELRAFLRELRSRPPAARRRFAQNLGQALARLHQAGFDHPDLYSKHVLVGGDGQSTCFLDWQRCRWRSRLSWRRRLAALAALHATVADDLASAHDRLRCLRAYSQATTETRKPFRVLAGAVQQRAGRLLRRRRLRELRRPPLAADAQNLIWLYGEALCVTRQFYAECRGIMPSWLGRRQHPGGCRNQLQRTMVSLPGGRQALLIERWTSRPLSWLFRHLWRGPVTVPEVQQAAALFCLQRAGIGTARLLAFGRRQVRPWQSQSFLLAESPAQDAGLARWLRTRSRPFLPAAQRLERWRIIREAGALLSELHEAGYSLSCGKPRRGCRTRTAPGASLHEDPGDAHLFVQTTPEQGARVVLGDPAGVQRNGRSSKAWRQRDQALLADLLVRAGCSRADRLRFSLSYLGLERLTAAGKRQIGRW